MEKREREFNGCRLFLFAQQNSVGFAPVCFLSSCCHSRAWLLVLVCVCCIVWREKKHGSKTVSAAPQSLRLCVCVCVTILCPSVFLMQAKLCDESGIYGVHTGERDTERDREVSVWRAVQFIIARAPQNINDFARRRRRRKKSQTHNVRSFFLSSQPAAAAASVYHFERRQKIITSLAINCKFNAADCCCCCCCCIVAGAQFIIVRSAATCWPATATAASTSISLSDLSASCKKSAKTTKQTRRERRERKKEKETRKKSWLEWISSTSWSSWVMRRLTVAAAATQWTSLFHLTVHRDLSAL